MPFDFTGLFLLTSKVVDKTLQKWYDNKRYFSIFIYYWKADKPLLCFLGYNNI